MKDHWLTITQEDIYGSIRGNKSSCVISTAFRRSHPGAMTITKFNQDARVVTLSTLGNFLVSSGFSLEIADWDCGRPLYPVSILLHEVD